MTCTFAEWVAALYREGFTGTVILHCRDGVPETAQVIKADEVRFQKLGGGSVSSVKRLTVASDSAHP